MIAVSNAIDAALKEVDAAQRRVKKVRKRQIYGVDDVASLKATALTWFHTHRPVIGKTAASLDLSVPDKHYTTILNATTKKAARQTYLDALKGAKKGLVAIRAELLTLPVIPPEQITDDLVPDFSPLAGDQEMRNILTRRWYECSKCVKADAHLAAIVMMGGLLEALFVARANRMPDKAPLIDAKSAPKDSRSGKTLNYQEWMLDAYIKVAEELGWITSSAKKVADVLKEYRNYIHPEKERRHGVVLDLNDSSIFWQVTREVVRQLLMSAKS